MMRQVYSTLYIPNNLLGAFPNLHLVPFGQGSYETFRTRKI